jgi:CheY-like chemotaxis protein
MRVTVGRYLARGEELESSKTTILIVEDNDDVRESLALLFDNAGFAVRLAADGIFALTTLADHRPDVMVSDLNMPRLGGQELLRLVRQCYPEVRTVAMSGEFSAGVVPPNIVADAFFAKGSDPSSRLLEILFALDCPSRSS